MASIEQVNAGGYKALIEGIVGRGYATIDGDDFTVSGVDGWDGTVVKRQDNGVVIVKVPGGMHWASRGQQAYHPAQYMVFVMPQDEPDEYGRIKGWAYPLSGFDVRSKTAKKP